MTFQEAQASFSNIVQTITPGLSAAELNQKMLLLQNLLDSLPDTVEFDPIANTIANFTPKLVGQVTQAVVTELREREAKLKAVTGMLNQVANKAQADARLLQFEQPKLIAAALINSVDTLKQVRDAVRAGNFNDMGPKIDGLLVLFEQIKSTIKSV